MSSRRSDDVRESSGVPRRAFLGMLGAAAGTVACVGSTPRLLDSESADVLAGDALDQAARVRSGEVTPLEMVEAAIERIEGLNGPLNAVTTRLDDFARREAVESRGGGVFSGVPFLLKDLNDLEGTPKSMGSHLFDGFVSTKSSPNADASREAGFIIVGKTNTPEFGLTATTESAALGPCRNPRDTAYSTGGSSGGAAAAVAAGMLPIAQASDGGGSIRVPASCCGVFGLKPSRGRNRAAPPTRAVDISVKHCVSRTVRDTAAYSTVVQRLDVRAPFAPLSYVERPSEKRLRIGFYTQNLYGQEADPDVRATLERTAALCEELGHSVIPAKVDFGGRDFIRHFLTVWTSIPAGILADVRKRGLDPSAVLEPVTLGMAERFAQAPENALDEAARYFKDYGARVEDNFATYDLLLSPVLKSAPPKIGTLSGTLPFEAVFNPMIEYVSYTPQFNASGHPAMSVPLDWNENPLPIGSQFIGPWGSEARLLELAFELEAAKGWT